MMEEKAADQIEWEEECMRWMGRILTGKYRHYCPDWDFLPIDETCSEFECCGGRDALIASQQ